MKALRILSMFFFLLACWTYGVSVPSGLFVPSLLCSFMYIYFFRYIQLENTWAHLHFFLPVGLLDVWFLFTQWSLCTFTLAFIHVIIFLGTFSLKTLWLFFIFFCLLDVWCLCTQWSICTLIIVWSNQRMNNKNPNSRIS